LLLLQPAESRVCFTKCGYLVKVFPEQGRPEMLIGNGFLLKAFDMYKPAMIFMICVTLASHTSRTIPLQVIEITTDNLLRLFLCAVRDCKGHEIPDHTFFGFG
jgi:hypothetical protein